MVGYCPDCGTATLHPVCPSCRVKRGQKSILDHALESEVDAFVRDLELDLDLLERFEAAAGPGVVEASRRWRDLPGCLRERSTQRKLRWID